MDRRNFIGASDIAAILGISPHKTPYKLWLEKTGQGEPEKDKPVFTRGKRWEPVALDMLLDNIEDTEGDRPQLLARNQRYTDDKHSFLSCEIDADLLYHGIKTNGEIKTIDVRKAYEWGEELTDEMPIHYAAQTMFGLGITGRDQTIVGALFGADQIVRYNIERDDETIKGMREKAVEFWKKNVIEMIPPDPINMEDMMAMFKKVNGKPLEITPEIYDRLLERKYLKDEIKAFEEQAEAIEFRVCEFIREQWGTTNIDSVAEDNAILTLGDKMVGSWKSQSRASLDTERLKKELPDVYSQFLRESYFRVLRLKK
jgi:putative phage-type endonuclease